MKQGCEPVGLRKEALLLVFLLLLAAAANGPLAVMCLLSNRSPQPRSLAVTPVPAEWPAPPPHANWPPPNAWDESRSFGGRYVNCFAPSFQMTVRFAGWPLPVILVKQRWWNWSDPALEGPEPDPRPELLMRGLVLNPLIIGSILYALIAGPFVPGRLRRMRRRARGQCIECGYDLRGSPTGVCPECGTPKRETPVV